MTETTIIPRSDALDWAQKYNAFVRDSHGAAEIVARSGTTVIIRRSWWVTCRFGLSWLWGRLWPPYIHRVLEIC